MAKKAPSLKTPTIQTPRTRALANLIYAREMIESLIEGIPDDRLVYQSAPSDGHILWQLGHVAHATDWFASLIDGAGCQVPKNYAGLFGMGSVPSADPSKYPPASEVKKHFRASHERICQAMETTADIDITMPPAEETDYVKDRLEAAERCAWHEGWHAGQISMLRRGAGLKPLDR